MRRSGFTLIELLVVIAIIAILAAILFPVFARARDRARQASCSSNMRQIGLGILMYAQDYDEMLPGFKIYWAPPDSNRRGDGWYEGIEPYTRNEQISICPSGQYSQTFGRGDLPNATGFWGRTITASYGVPAQDSTCRDVLGNLGTAWNYYPPGRRLAEATRPSETVILFESNHNWTQQTSGYGYDNSGNLRPIGADGSRGRHTFRHSMQMNVVFMDGHVRSMHPGDMANLDLYRMIK